MVPEVAFNFGAKEFLIVYYCRCQLLVGTKKRQLRMEPDPLLCPVTARQRYSDLRGGATVRRVTVEQKKYIQCFLL
jgi:hypothetical protein